MKYKAIFYLLFIVFYSINAFGSDLTLPKPLNNNDEKLYRKVFELQTQGKFKESEKLIQNKKDRGSNDIRSLRHVFIYLNASD